MWLKMNPIVVAFILSEAFFWSAWNFIAPIFAVFVVNSLPNGNIRVAAFGFTIYLFVRVITELFISSYVKFPSDRKRMITDSGGMVLLSISYLVIAFFPSLITFYMFFIIAGMSFAISSPAKFSMFSLNLGRAHASKTWGMYHAVTLTGMGIATALGGVIANQFGFKVLFLIASTVNILGIIPYWYYNTRHKDHKHFTGE